MLLPVHDRLQVLHANFPQHTSSECPAGQQQCLISDMTKLVTAASVMLAIAAVTQVVCLLWCELARDHSERCTSQQKLQEYRDTVKASWGFHQ